MQEPKQTVKAARMVMLDGECYEVRDLEGLLATDPSKAVVVYRIDKTRRVEIGRLSSAVPPTGSPGAGDEPLTIAVVTKWFGR